MVLGRAAVHTAVTGWIDTLCSPRYLEDDLEGITELVESINLQQATGYDFSHISHRNRRNRKADRCPLRIAPVPASLFLAELQKRPER